MSPHSLRVPIVGGGFPHSEIHGSKPVRGSPWLIAAYHVFHRLSVPRHPPNALTTLDRSHDRCPPLGRGCAVLSAMGHRRNKTSLLHDLTRAGGQARPRGRRYGHAGSSLRNRPMTKPVKSPLHDVGQPAAAPDGAAANLFHLRRTWWSQTGSNRRPHACKARALPAELWPLQEHRRSFNAGSNALSHANASPAALSDHR